MSGARINAVSAVAGVSSARRMDGSGYQAGDQPAHGEPNPEWQIAWDAALDELELEVERAEALLNPRADAPIPERPRTDFPETAPHNAALASSYGLPRQRTAIAAPDVRPALPAGEQHAAEPVVESAEVSEAQPVSEFAPLLPPGRPWQPPQVPGPLPEDLHKRAVALLDRQLAVAEGLARAMTGSRQHLGLIDRFEGGRDETRSAYLDQDC